MSAEKNNYEERIVCFMDLLAFKGLIESTENNGVEVVEQTEFVKSLFSLILNELENNLDNSNFDKVIKVTHFSDSIILSVSLKEDSALFHTINSLQFFLLELLKHKILIRGGITIGKLYHDGNTVFGPALNMAYQLENEIAKYPRIIIHMDTINEYLKTCPIKHDPETEKEYLFDLLSLDTDSYAFVDYFNVSFTQFDSDYDGIIYMQYLRNFIINNVIQYDSIKGIKTKNTWLIKKYNQMIVNKNREYHIKFQSNYNIRKIERKKLI